MGGPINIPDGARPITRRLLATFLEYAVKGMVNMEEVRRFLTTSYDDELMMKAVAEFRDLIPYPSWVTGHGTITRQPFPKEAAERAYAIAKELREAPDPTGS
jgi:hypothetical protein